MIENDVVAKITVYEQSFRFVVASNVASKAVKRRYITTGGIARRLQSCTSVKLWVVVRTCCFYLLVLAVNGALLNTCQSIPAFVVAWTLHFFHHAALLDRKYTT